MPTTLDRCGRKSCGCQRRPNAIGSTHSPSRERSRRLAAGAERAIPIARRKRARGTRPCRVSVLGPESLDEEVAKAHGLEIVGRNTMSSLGLRLVRYRIPDGRSLSSVVERLKADPRVESAQANVRYALPEQQHDRSRRAGPASRRSRHTTGKDGNRPASLASARPEPKQKAAPRKTPGRSQSVGEIKRVCPRGSATSETSCQAASEHQFSFSVRPKRADRLSASLLCSRRTPADNWKLLISTSMPVAANTRLSASSNVKSTPAIRRPFS